MSSKTEKFLAEAHARTEARRLRLLEEAEREIRQQKLEKLQAEIPADFPAPRWLMNIWLAKYGTPFRKTADQYRHPIGPKRKPRTVGPRLKAIARKKPLYDPSVEVWLKSHVEQIGLTEALNVDDPWESGSVGISVRDLPFDDPLEGRQILQEFLASDDIPICDLAPTIRMRRGFMTTKAMSEIDPDEWD